MSDTTAEAFPAFRPRAPWLGGDLQTLRNRCRQWAWPELTEWAPRKLTFAMNDGSGDVLPATLQWPDRATVKPLVALIHGLTGCEDSSYIRYSTRHWLGLGYPTLRLNMRAAGPARTTCSQMYHAGRSEDLRAILAQLTPELARNGIVLIGYSLGANIMLKYLGEEGEAAPVKAAVAISAPIDLADTSRRMLALRNRLYTKFLLGGLKRTTLAGDELSEIQRRKVGRTRTVYQFDEVYIAPRNGFRDPEHYYASCSAFRFMPGIRVPTLMIHAPNDPWIPIDAYRRFTWDANDRLVPLLDAPGGHVGFHGADSETAWHDRCAAAFLKNHGMG